MAEYAINGDIATLLGNDHTPGDPAALWVEASQPVILDGTTGRLGGKIRVPLASDGTFTLTGLPETVGGATPLYRLTVDSRSLRRTGTTNGYTTKWFPLTTNRDLTWIVANYVDIIGITPAVAANVAAAAALGATNDTATASFVTNGASATRAALATNFAAKSAQTTVETGRLSDATLKATFGKVFTPEQYGAVGNGVADDTSAVQQAFAAASALRIAGLGGNIWHPGGTVLMQGTYKLTTLAAPITVACNVRSEGSTLIVPNAYAQSVLLVGDERSGQVLHSADISLPNVIKSGATTLPAGSTGVQLQNLHHSRVRTGRVTHFQTGLWFTALGAGNVYNEFFPGWVDLCAVSWRLSIQTAGWVNQNTFIAGGITQSPNAYGGAATRRTGWRHILLDGGTGDTIHGNTFVGSSLEGDYSEYAIEFKNAAENSFVGNIRFEQGTPGVAATASASFNVFTIADASALSAGAPVVFMADSAPGGVTLGQMYWVFSVGGNDFNITTTPGGGGTILDITSAGTNVKMYRPPTIHFDNSSGFTRDNIIREYNLWPGRELHIKRTGAAAPAVKTTIVG